VVVGILEAAGFLSVVITPNAARALAAMAEAIGQIILFHLDWGKP
jgi:hypothetical protein